MPIRLDVDFDTRALDALDEKTVKAAIRRALSKAGSTALRDMKSEASRRIRQRKRLKVAIVNKAFRLRRPRGNEMDGGEWGLDVSGKAVPLIAYGPRQTKKGVSVEVNRGKRTLIKGAFVATSKGVKSVFMRKGSERLPIKALMGSRPVDALLHAGEADGVQQRGARSFGDTFNRLLPLELEKGKG